VTSSSWAIRDKEKDRKRVKEKTKTEIRFMETSSTHPWVQTFVDLPDLRNGEARRGKGGRKKIPSLHSKDRGSLTASTLHSLILEDLVVKDIRARFSDFPDLNLPSHPEPVEGQWRFR
jgi:hypothetical protein